MNKRELVAAAAENLRNKGSKKSVALPKHTFHISDDEGASKDFVVQGKNREVSYTAQDVNVILQAVLDEMTKAIARGEPVIVHGYWAIGPVFRKARRSRIPGTNKWANAPARFSPKIQWGTEFKRAAALFGQTDAGEVLKDALAYSPERIGLDVSEDEDEY